jgi:putative OPT family oligopeptide transporter
VCIAAANAGATSQDLKTGHLVGATPIYQQLGVVIGVLASSFAIGWTLMAIDASMSFEGVQHAIGSERYAAPQATLMATIIKGLLAQDLPWGLVFIGFAIAITMELCGIRSLSFAVGVYLPISTTLPIAVGGLVKGLVDKAKGLSEESEVSPGMLYATGLVAGGSLTGVLIAILSGVPVSETINGVMKDVSLMTFVQNKVGVHGFEHLGGMADAIGAAMFVLLALLLARTAMKKSAT